MRGENDSKQLDEFQAKFYLNRMDFVTEMFSRERPKEDEKLMNIPGGGGMKGILYHPLHECIMHSCRGKHERVLGL